MASKAAQKRLTKEYVAMQREPPPFIWAVPDEKNILTWNYIIRGPPDSPFAGGEYHGVLLFPSEYPFKPPGIKMLTPSGRFHPDKKICFSMSDFHPGTWNPAWSVATILTGLLSFMLSDEMTTGSVTSSDAQKRAYASRSHMWNLGQVRFKEAFPEYCTPTVKEVPNMGESVKGSSSSAPPTLTFSSSPISPATITTTTTSIPTPITTPKTIPIPAIPNIVVPASEGRGEDKHTSANTAASWGQIMWEKWRWGLLIALAVLLSRLSSAQV
ncbi:Ubiquitin-conjugating enzyme E2 6 [Marasmius crinis-equi]|uniref:Ubiquitin-conjugating enzyme E2 6 n=1 Tax=Marasmius crinis-equi TaxID=585013 RepID=A0ABR3G1U5_9AGAR